eukprot:16442678-Heterocapsa_arctica.AAC.1
MRTVLRGSCRAFKAVPVAKVPAPAAFLLGSLSLRLLAGNRIEGANDLAECERVIMDEVPPHLGEEFRADHGFKLHHDDCADINVVDDVFLDFGGYGSRRSPLGIDCEGAAEIPMGWGSED